MANKTAMTLVAAAGLIALAAIPALAQTTKPAAKTECSQHETATMSVERMQQMMSEGPHRSGMGAADHEKAHSQMANMNSMMGSGTMMGAGPMMTPGPTPADGNGG